MNRMMLDIETLGVKPDATILSIGCVLFNADGIFWERQWFVDDQRGSFDIGTVRWWISQVQQGTTFPEAYGEKDLRECLEDLTETYDNFSVDEVWARSPSFDLVILETAFRAEGLRIPWHYRGHRDMRTLAALYPHIKTPDIPKHVRHGALNDAYFQAQWVFTCLKEHYGKVSSGS